MQKNASLQLSSRSNRILDAFPATAMTLPTARQSINQTCQRTPSQIRLCHAPDSVVSRPKGGRITSQIRLRFVPDSLSNTGSLTEIIGLGSEMVIPPSPPSIIRNTDWSILRNKNDWILHNFERHFSDITNRRSFPFNTECLPEYQTPPLTNFPPEQSSQNASRQIINTNKKRTLDCSNVLPWGTQQIRTAVHGFADRYLATRSGYRCCLFASAKLKLYFHSTKLFSEKYLFLSKIWQAHIVKNHYFSYL